MIEQIITSSILIVTVLILSGLLERRMNPCIRYALWLLVVVKLLVPVPEFESVISVMNLVTQVEETGQEKHFENLQPHYNVLINQEAPLNHTVPVDMSEQISQTIAQTESIHNTQNTTAESIRPVDGATVCRILWIVGMVLCAGVFVWSNLRFSREVKRNRKPAGCFRDKLNVYQVSGIASPCLFGVLEPSIYLQEGCELSKEQKEYVCAHEYTHYRHGDHIWAIVRCVCVIVYWYNPLVWVAARVSMKDSELACDAGTLKLIGENHKIEYGRTLVELAGDKATRAFGTGILGCSTGATGGVKEMKKRIQMITKRPVTKMFSFIIMILTCISIVGCTFSDAVSESDASEEGILSDEATDNTADDAALEAALKEAIEEEKALQEEVKKQEAALIQEAASLVSQEFTYKDTVLYENPLYDENKVCIRVQPSALGVRDQLSYYYVPSEEDQEWLVNQLKSLKLEGQPFAKRWKGMKETGWQLIYNGWQFMVFEGGYLYCTYDDNGVMEIFVEAPKLCDYIQIMLQEDLDYYAFDPADIKGIKSAKLGVCSVLTNWEFRSQTITDEETLTSLEKLLSEAEYIYGGADCVNNMGCLELTLDDGEVVHLSMATDSCDNFGINGVYYDYHPKAGGDNSLFYQYFDELTAENTGELRKHISDSRIYSPEEIEEAIVAVEEASKKQFADCTLKEITYYESFSNKYADQWAAQYEADQAIVFTSDIEVPAANADGHWSMGGTYHNFEWILTRNEGESWVVRTWRY